MLREPEKAKYYEMEEDGDVEWEFFIAQKLGMTVQEMCERMSNEEFEHWKIYFGRVAQKRELAIKAAENSKKLG